MGFVLCVSVVTEVLFTTAHPVHVFYLIPTRVYEFLIGIGMAAFLGSTKRVFGTKYLPLIVVFMMVLLAARMTDQPLLVKFSVLILTLLFLLFSASGTKSSLRRFWKPLEFIGENSYAIYLVHQPLFVFVRLFSNNKLTLYHYFLLTGLSILLGFLTTRFIEEPIRLRAKSDKKVLKVLCSSVILLLIFQIANVKSNGSLSFLPHETQIINNQLRNTDYEYGTCFLPEELPESSFSSQCVYKLNGRYSDTILWGDSHAASLAFGLKNLVDESGLLASSSCIPVLNERLPELCKRRNLLAIREISKAQPKNLILEADWQSNLELSAESLPETIRYINKVSPRSKILVLGPLPTWNPSLSKVIARKHYDPSKPKLILVSDPRTLEATEKVIKRIADQSGSEYLSLTGLTCIGDRCQGLISYNGKIEYTAYDYVHLTRAGSILYGSKVAQYLLTSSISR
jgi:hypothetical protein